MNRRSFTGVERATFVLIGCLCASTLPGCPAAPPAGSPSNANDNSGGAAQRFTEDTTLASFSVRAGETAFIENDAVVTVTGDASVEGTIAAATGRLTLRVEGDLAIGGRLESGGAAPSDEEGDIPLREQTVGIFILVGDGAITFDVGAEVLSAGPVVITDDDSVFDETPNDLYAQVEDVSGDDLPTFVPLPPESDASARSVAPVKGSSAITEQVAGGGPVTVSGVWPPAGMVVPGDRPVIILRFNGTRPLNLDGWTVNGPAAPPADPADGTANPGASATGRGGRNGLRLNILNNGGPINLMNDVVFNLADGGAGADATAVCAEATGGPGGLSGNLRMSAAGGIDMTAGTLTINPGRGGNGGNATVVPGAAGAAGCPGSPGDGGSAEGGAGAANQKRLFVRGNVAGLENVTFGDVVGGNGGAGDAIVCDGGPGIVCCDGGPGGAAAGGGGKGGDASLDVGVLPVAVGAVRGGDGGTSLAVGGNGGDGGDCKFGDAGDGGAGGDATATGGAGGAATSSADPAQGGMGGDATALGGTGGAGGDSAFGAPGSGGAGGVGITIAGAGGLAVTPGLLGPTNAQDGPDGPAGGTLPSVVFCLTLAEFLAVVPGSIAPGERQGPVRDFEGETQIGTIDIEFVAGAQSSYQSSDVPVPHVGLDNGTLAIDAESLRLNDGPPGTILGIRLEPLFGNGLSEGNPLVVQALDADGQVLDAESLASLPNNFANPQEPESVDVLFQTDEQIAIIQIIAPPGSFVTIIRIYLLDP